MLQLNLPRLVLGLIRGISVAALVSSGVLGVEYNTLFSYVDFSI